MKHQSDRSRRSAFAWKSLLLGLAVAGATVAVTPEVGHAHWAFSELAFNNDQKPIIHIRACGGPFPGQLCGIEGFVINWPLAVLGRAQGATYTSAAKGVGMAVQVNCVNSPSPGPWVTREKATNSGQLEAVIALCPVNVQASWSKGGLSE